MPNRLIEVELTITGREVPELTGGWYRPHLRVAGGQYLGVSFVEGPGVHRGETVLASAALAYEPGVDYSALVAGVSFEVLEGTNSVGFGHVIRGPYSP